MEKIELVITDVIGKTSAILHSDGLILFEKLQAYPEKAITLSFKGISHCTTAFLNASIGKFILSDPMRNLEFSDYAEDIKRKINLVLDNARNEKKRSNLDDSARSFFYA